ncbi:MAG: cation:proton antiporter [Thermoleophilia bacterium]|nr:cation:proton antiporter [Thermoleophilia bacterium]
MTAAALVAASSAVETHKSVGVLGDVVIVLALCVVFGLAARKLGQSVLVGYLIAGVVAGGPTSLRLIDDPASLSFMGEVGVALLLFTVGLDLPLSKLRKHGSTALAAGTGQVLLTSIVAGAIANALGRPHAAAFVVAVAVSLSSTAVVIRVLADRAESDSVHGLVTTGVLIVQDVFVVLVLLVIPLLPGSTAASADAGLAASIGIALAKLVAIVVGIGAVERIALRRMFRAANGHTARELLALASLTISLGAIGACWALDLSPALGGFIAGIVMADAAYAPQVRSEIAPIRMGLLAVFFAYVGMLADLDWMLDNLWAVVLALVGIIVGKAALAFVAATIARVPRPAAIMSAASLAQVGEFSFVVLTLGTSVGLVHPDTLQLLVSTSVLSLLLTPALIQTTSRMQHAHTLSRGEDLDVDDMPNEHAGGGQAIVVGVGPSGRSVAAALAGSGVPLVVVELNPRPDTGPGDDDGLPAGTRVVFGDAGRPEILARAGIAEARILVVTVPDPVAIRTIIQQSRQLAPDVPIVARGRYNRFVDEVRAAGADDVVDEENVTGRELAEVALRRLVLAGDVERRRSADRRGSSS